MSTTPSLSTLRTRIRQAKHADEAQCVERLLQESPEFPEAAQARTLVENLRG